MNNLLTLHFWKVPFVGIFLFANICLNVVQAQSFSQKNLNFNGIGSLNNGTSLSFGPDGRLYVTEYMGSIKIFTIEREGPGDYVVTSMEEIKGIQNIQDYNDDGTLHAGSSRETIGLVVTGTAANPVIYVSSSDFRIGGGGGGGSGDVGLDTNSGIITRYTWNGTSWSEIDIVRGLPRSEENHATNGIDLATINGVDYLIVAQGGHTNAGGPSANFAYTSEYALSAAVLSVNLNMLKNMPIQDDNGRKYIYDLPTVDDPTRVNKNGIIDPDAPGYDGVDVNDPFGGNDGLNQAIIEPGGPVQIFSPGYRNAYDLVVTEKGAVYVTDNGANGGWGGFPVNEGGANANNAYDPNEPGSTSSSGEEQVNNKDHLSLITLDMQNYVFGSFYGGHPTPIRANPDGAGLYTNPAKTGTEGAVFRTLKYHPTKSTDGYTTDPNLGLPADWPPVSYANPAEGDWRGPGMSNPDGPADALVTVWGTNTNGIAEYTASNFEGAMKGNLLAGVNTGELRRVELNEDGSLKTLTASFASGLGGDALGVTCNGDNSIFPGTIWVATLNGYLIVLEPQDFVVCLAPGDPDYDALADNDNDGYTNQDEVDNNSDPCNGGSQPNDFDKSAGGTLVSNLNDPDDDNDGIADSQDRFQLGDPVKEGSDAFAFPVINELFSSNSKLKGYMGLGMTGLMNNNDPNPNWIKWLDRRDDPNDPNPNDILGGAIGAMTMQMTQGTALEAVNSQEKGFQYGVQVEKNSGVFTVSGGLMNFDAPLQLYGHTEAPDGELGLFLGDGTQSNYIKFVVTKSGLYAQQEINDVAQNPVFLGISNEQRPKAGIAFYFIVDAASGNVVLEASFDGNPRMKVGTIQAEGSILNAMQNATQDLAVGFIGTSNAPGVELEGTWDFLNVTGAGPYVVQDILDIESTVGTMGAEMDLNQYFGDDKGVENLIYTVESNTNSSIGASISNNLLKLDYLSSAAETQITVRATDIESAYVEQSFNVRIIEQPVVLHRVNAGGPATPSIDNEMDWQEDSSANNTTYLLQPGTNQTYSSGKISYSAGVDQTATPVSIFDTERFDGTAGEPNLSYSFPVPEVGDYEIRLYMGNGYDGTSQPEQRIFDVSIEGIVHPELDNLDLSATFGHQVGGVITKMVEVTDGSIDVVFIHNVENPLINGIEILGTTAGGSTPIVITQLKDQANISGEELDGNLVISATGGDGNLNYSMVGAPAGVNIEPTNGQIGGVIDSEAHLGSPYEVQIVVDDGDEYSHDAANISFTWYVTNGEPVIVENMPNLIRDTNAASEVLDLYLYFDDNDGAENLIFTVEGNTDPTIGASISGNLLTLAFPSEVSTSTIKIRATDATGLFAEQDFNVTVEESVESLILYRVNAGGALIAAMDDDMDWSADTGANNSAYLSVAGTNTTSGFSMTGYSESIDQNTTPVSIFSSERYDGAAGEPNLSYSFPVAEAGQYEIRLYMGNGYGGTSEPGQRVFDISIENVIHPELDNIDLSATFGHQVGGIISKAVEVTDGSIDIVFLHNVENPLINGIEILGTSAGGSIPIEVAAIEDQTNTVGDVLDGSLMVSATGGDGDLIYSMTGAPLGVSINSDSGIISGTIDSEADTSSPYSVVIKVDDSDAEAADAITSSFTWTVSETPQTPIQVAAIEDQTNTVGDLLDGSLVVSATGGDGDLVYSITGAPLGVIINSATGVISGTIDSEAETSSPYSVEVKVDDGDAEAKDAAIIGFTWTVTVPGVFSWISKDENEDYTARHECSFVQAGDKFYLMGGRESAKTVDIYDYTSNDWTSLIDSAPFEFNHYQALEYQGLIWVIGAFQTNSYPTETPAEYIWMFDPAKKEWIQGPKIPEGRRRGSAGLAIYDGKFYVVGGNTIGHDGGYVPFFDEYDPHTGTWTPLADAPRARDHFQVAVIGTKLYAAGGRLSGGSEGTFRPLVPEVDVYDFQTSSWSTLPQSLNIPTPRAAAAVVAFKEKLVVIGGEVAGEMVYGVQVDDALKVTEEYDPVNSVWRRFADLNFERHGTQAIASGEGIYTTAGSPNRGGGNQKNMEFLGEDAPIGEPLISSDFVIPDNLDIVTGKSGEIDLQVLNGNVGLVITSMQISGTNAGSFEITSGKMTHGLLTAGSTHVVQISHSGSVGETANLVINYGVSGQSVITLNSTGDKTIQVAQIGDQTNTVRDVLDGSLVVSANGGDGNLVYSMTGAPSGVNINSATGVISGIISSEADTSSPYSVVIKVDDSDAESADAVTTGFTWTVSETPQTPIQVAAIEDQANTVGDELDGSVIVSATGGDGDLTYSMTGAPSGVSINSGSGAISGTINSEADTSSPYSVVIKVDDSDAESADAVTTGFTWTVSETPQTPIQVAAIEDQANAVGDVLDGSLIVSAIGGDGDLIYSMIGAPLGVSINSTSGVINGTIDSEADTSSPYSVVVKVDDSDAESADAVATGFTWTVNEACENILTWYLDSDGDGFGDLDNTKQSCEQPLDYVSNNEDCDDIDSSVGAATLWYADKDNDGYGDPGDSTLGCTEPAGFVASSTDCKDSDASIYPGATEVPNDGIDQDCDGEDLVEVVYQGCTAEYWAGSSNWCSTYQPAQNFFTVFGITNKRGVGGKSGTLTLQEALNLKKGGYDKLAKQATAALLNGCSSAVNYQYSEAQIKAEVQDAFNNTAYNNSHGNNLAGKYDIANNAGCPIASFAIVASKSKEEVRAVHFDELSEESSMIKLFPNPADAEAYLQVPDPSVKITAVAVDDHNGRYIKTYYLGHDLEREGNERYRFNISQLPNGVFILRVSTENSGGSTLRLIKKD